VARRDAEDAFVPSDTGQKKTRERGTNAASAHATRRGRAMFVNNPG
jgi:hypothetical protein